MFHSGQRHTFVPQWAETHTHSHDSGHVMWKGTAVQSTKPPHRRRTQSTSQVNMEPPAGGGTGLILQSIQSGLSTHLLPLMHFNGSAFAHRLGGEHE